MKRAPEPLHLDTHDGRHLFTIKIDLGGRDAEGVRVELFADSVTAISRFAR